MERRPPDPSIAAAELIRCLDALEVMEQRRRQRPIAATTAAVEATTRIVTKSGAAQLVGAPEGYDPRVLPRQNYASGTDEMIVNGTISDNSEITCQSSNHQYREYQSVLNKSCALPVTEEVMAEKLAFQRGSNGRRSLPTKTILNGTAFSPASRTLAHLPVPGKSGPGLLFLTFNGKTRKVALPSSIDSITVVWTLFSKAFPFIPGNSLNSDQYQVYIHDRVADRFFLLTSLDDVQDGTMLKLVIVKSENTRGERLSPYSHFSMGTSAVHYAGHVGDDLSSPGTTCTSTESRQSRTLKEVELVSSSRDTSADDRSEVYSSKSGSSTGSDDSYTRSKVAMLEAQLSQLTHWMRSMFSGESETVCTGSVVHPLQMQQWQFKERDQLKINGVPHKKVSINSHGYRAALKRVMCQARDLKTEVRSLKNVHLAQAESMAEQFVEVKRQILSAVGCIVNRSRARMALIECMSTDKALVKHRDGVSRLEQQLSKIERCVDELRTNVVTHRASIDIADIEAYAAQLSETSRSATDVKASLRLVRDDFRRSAIHELMHSTEQKRFIEKQPQQQANTIKRIEELTFDLSNLKRCVGSDAKVTEATPVETCGLPLECKVEQNLVDDTVHSAIKDSIEPSKRASAHNSTTSSDRPLLSTEFYCKKNVKSDTGDGGATPIDFIRDRIATIDNWTCNPSGAFIQDSLGASYTQITTKIEVTSKREVPISRQTDVKENDQSTQDCNNGLVILEKVGDTAAWLGDVTACASAATTEVKEALTRNQPNGDDGLGLTLDANDQETSSCLPHTSTSSPYAFPTGCDLPKKKHCEPVANARLCVSEMPIESGRVTSDAMQAHASSTYEPRPTVTTRVKPPVAPKPILRLLQMQQSRNLKPGLSEQPCSVPRVGHGPSRAQPLSTAL